MYISYSTDPNYYHSQLDDGSSTNAERITVAGLAGDWLKMNAGLRATWHGDPTSTVNFINSYADSLTDEHMQQLREGVVQDLNYNIVREWRDTERARQMAHYEDALRTVLPAAQIAMLSAVIKYNECIDRFGGPEPFLDQKSTKMLVSVADTIDAMNDYRHSLGSDLAAEYETARQNGVSAQSLVFSIVEALHRRAFEAGQDYDSGINNAQTVYRQDWTRYAANLQ